MARRNAFHTWWSVLVLALTVTLAGCGGHPEDPHPFTAEVTVDAQSTLTLAGTVAAGAPLIGTLEIKDKNGTRKQAQVDESGTYRVGLKGLTFPLLLRASGQVGGHSIVLVSAATSSDAGLTVNVTPFTDLIVANVAGQAAEDFYESPDFSRLTDAYLDQARVMVTQHIAPVLDELHVDKTLDLRRSAFAADHTKLDALLDVIRVDVDPASQTATIRDVINGTSIIDNLTDMNDRAVLPTPATGSYASAVGALVAIDQVLGVLNGLFTSALPAVDRSDLRDLFEVDFMHAGADLATFLSASQLLSDGNVAVRLVNPVIVERSADGRSVRVAVQVRDTLGHVIAYDQVDSDELLFRQGSDGHWRVAGDRRRGDVSITSINYLMLDDTSVSGRAIELWVPSASSAVRYVGFSGPGLPGATAVSGVGSAAGVLLHRASATDHFQLIDVTGQAMGTNWLKDCVETSANTCVDVGAMPVRAEYAVRFYDALLNPIGELTTVTVARPPLAALTALTHAAAWFASPHAFSPGSFQALSDGAALAVSWLPATSSDHLSVGEGLMSGEQAWYAPLNGPSASVNLGNWRGAAPSQAPTVWSVVAGPHDRQFVAVQRYPGAGGVTP